MIFDRIERVSAYAPQIRFAAEIDRFCREHELETLPAGRYDICGDDLYMNLQTAVTAPFPERSWESHDLYADLQLVVSGEESFGASCAALPEPQEARPESDIRIYKSMPGPVSVLTLSAGEFVFFAPGEPHMPCGTTGTPGTVKKAVFKIRQPR